MPYKCEKLIKLAGTSQESSAMNKKMRLFLLMNVQNARRTIQFLWDPDKIKANLQRRMERGGSKIYYSKEKNREYMKLHRHYKQEIYLKEYKND